MEKLRNRRLGIAVKCYVLYVYGLYIAITFLILLFPFYVYDLFRSFFSVCTKPTRPISMRFGG